MTNKVKVSLSVGVFAAFCLSNAALADGHDVGKWFAEGRFNTSVSESTSIYDADTDPVVSSTGDSWSGRDSMGMALGYSYGNGSSFSIGYETFGTANLKLTTATTRSGSVITNVDLPVKVTNIILEYSHQFPISDSLFAIGVLGLGQAEKQSKTYTASGTSNLGTPKTTTDMSTRFGLGMGYNLSEKVQIIGIAQQSNYGYSEILSPLVFKSKVSGIEASVRLRVLF